MNAAVFEIAEQARQLARRDKRRAWTGGSAPHAYGELSEVERALCVLFYSDQVDTWQDYWHEAPDAGLRRLFWDRARADAHATVRSFEANSGRLVA